MSQGSGDDEKRQDENPLTGPPYGGRDQRPEGADLPGERPDVESATQGVRRGAQRTPMSSRAAEEPMDSDAVEPYVKGEQEPGPPDPLKRQDES
jgi:hypothetical protein